MREHFHQRRLRDVRCHVPELHLRETFGARTKRFVERIERGAIAVRETPEQGVEIRLAHVSQRCAVAW